MTLFYSTKNDLFDSAFIKQSTTIIAAHHYNDLVHKGSSPLPCQSRSVHEIYVCLGPIYSQQAYHMSSESFWCLHTALLPCIKTSIEEFSKHKKVGGISGGNYVLPLI